MSGTTDTGTVIGVLLRITWMLAGHIMTAISAIYIIRETKTYYSVWGVVFWSIPLFLSLVCLETVAKFSTGCY